MPTKPTPSFPAAVWSGASETRLDYVNDWKQPTQEDWDRLVEEIQAMQTDDRAYGLGVFQITTPNSATDTDFVVPYKIRVVDVFAMKIAANGSSTDAVTLKNGSTAITNAMSLAINDQLLARATSINDAQTTVLAGGTLRATTVKTTDCQSIVNVLYIKQD